MVIRADAMLTGKSEALFRGLSGNIPFAWSITFFVLAGMFLFLSGYHRWVLPRPSGDIQGSFCTVKEVFREFWKTFVSFFRKKENRNRHSFYVDLSIGRIAIVETCFSFYA